MSILETLQGWWKTEQMNWTLAQIPSPQIQAVPDAFPAGQALEANKGYITVRMRSMAISASRAGWNLFHAALHAETTIGLRNGDTALIQSVLSPDFLHDLDAAHLQRVLHIDRTIFGPMPYTGGPLSLNMGVFAVQHEDLAAPFLNVLETMATTAGVAFIGAAAPFVGPIKKGIELLTGTSAATSLEIGLLREYDPPVTGWYALVRLPGGAVDPKDLTVSSGNFELLRSGKSMPGTPYLLFSIDGAASRPDWARIPELKAAYADFSAAVKDDDQAKAKEAVDTFTRMARICPELLRTHVTDVISGIRDEYNSVFPDENTAAPTKGLMRASRKDVAPELRGLAVKFHAPM
jgi:hypothetical protein